MSQPYHPAEPFTNTALTLRTEEISSSDLSLQMNHNGLHSSLVRRLAFAWIASKAFHVLIRQSVRPERPQRASFPPTQWDGVWRSARWNCLPLALLALLSGCSLPAVHQQRLVAKPNMTFSDSAAFTYNSPKLLSQLAPGFAGAGGAQNSGCTSCR